VALERAELDLARQEFDQAARRIEPLTGERARYDLACCALGKGEVQEAARLFEALAGDTATGILARHQAGESRLRLREIGAARDHFEQAARAGERNPILESSLLRKAECEGLLEQWKTAERSFRSFLEARSESPSAHQE